MWSVPRRFERPFDRGLDVRRTAVDDAGVAPGVGYESELRGDPDPVASALDGLPDDLLAQERPVDLGGVDMRDAEIERAVDRAARPLVASLRTTAAICTPVRRRHEH